MRDRCSDLGERELVRRITGILEIWERDDCAMVEDGDKYLVWTTDILHRRADFPGIATGWQIGWMAVAVNLSDVAAMGAVPIGLLIAAGMPPETEVTFVEEIFRGMKDCAGSYATGVLGGDLDSIEELTLSGTALGWVERDLILRRRGARPGDLLCTTGTLGSAGSGLRVALEAEGRGERAVDDPDLRALMRRLLEPSPRLEEGRALALSGAVTSMMDNSDGLALSLFDLSEAGGVGFLVQEERIPIDPLVSKVAEDGDDAIDLALYSGGDFELVFTVRQNRIDEVSRACDLTVIGTVLEERKVLMEAAGARRRLEPRGYEHMRPPGSAV
ncbi:thiamine-phosphate kinase [Candidatus Methanocrinis natronophilus]|uniref:Thiamine-monophosphate kinase n=1 Tax=Candidatus Methanocrinis natronophilus TaxID=3033396 RepID=A0ABT5X9V1_9EURY|nr:thiamine-phosphate kinase [Candidatus Methanocrinis natronophilus]MDF0591452.1 thiamine-phosphate kinase [Candidatus Methanocrinis natronophilus]